VSSIATLTGACSRSRATGEVVWERKIACSCDRRTLTIRAAHHPRSSIVALPGANFGIRAYRGTESQHRQRPLRPSRSLTGDPRQQYLNDGRSAGSRRRIMLETATYIRTDTFLPGHLQFRARIGTRSTSPGTTRCASVLAINPSDGQISGAQYTPPRDGIPMTATKLPSTRLIKMPVLGEDRSFVVHAARNGYFYRSTAPTARFIAVKQDTYEMNWTPGLDPNTGKPLNYNPNSDVRSIRGQPTAAAQAKA